MIRTALMAGLALAISTASAQTPMVPYTNGPIGPGQWLGMDFPGAQAPMIPNTTSGSGPPPSGCSGAADFSDGCAIAVFGH